MLADRGGEGVALGDQTSLVDDLAFDSLDFVDLTVALEQALEIDGLPMQDWADREMATDPPRFTLGNLVAMCDQLLAQRAAL